MEDVLNIYTSRYDPLYPWVCFDETSKQLVAEKVEPKPIEPGQVQRYDYQYERNGGRRGWKNTASPLYTVCLFK